MQGRRRCGFSMAALICNRQSGIDMDSFLANTLNEIARKLSESILGWGTLFRDVTSIFMKLRKRYE